MFNFLPTINMTRNYVATLVLGAGLLGFGMGASAECVLTEDGSGIQTQTLFAGQTIKAGTVALKVINTDLVITYNTTGGWQLTETHLWIGGSLIDMPQTRQGNPKIGNFPYQSGDITGDTTYSVSIPLNVLGFSCPSDNTTYYVATHASLQKVNSSSGEVIQTETGWGDGKPIVDRGSWATYFTIMLTCTCDGGGDDGASCETAFAYAGGTNEINDDITNSFLDIVDEDGGSFNRWGWSNGLVGEGVYMWDIYAGAGQSDISKGTLVGILTVNYVGGIAAVNFKMNSPYYMTENHLYVGNEILPRDVNGDFTIAPGQYDSLHEGLVDSTDNTHWIESLSGDIYVVAHANVCGF